MKFLLLLAANANAQEAAKAAAPAGGLTQFAPLIIIFVMFYFLILRPQKKKIEQENEVLGKLAKGDEVFTKSGILGKIYGITDKVITLEVEDGVKIKVLKAQVGGLAKTIFEEAKK